MIFLWLLFCYRQVQKACVNAGEEDDVIEAEKQEEEPSEEDKDTAGREEQRPAEEEADVAKEKEQEQIRVVLLGSNGIGRDRGAMRWHWRNM